MKPVAPTLPVSQELFRDMVRLHVYGRTDEALAKELNIELRVVREVRWGFQEQWDAAVEALIPTFTKEMVFQTVAAIHLLASMTTDTKELTTLAHAEERHLRLVQGKKARATSKPKEEPQPEAAPVKEAPKEEPKRMLLTPEEVAHLQQLQDESPTNTHFIYALQQEPELYLKCLKEGFIPVVDAPPPVQPTTPPAPPTPAPRRSWRERFWRVTHVAFLLASGYLWGSVIRDALTHPPNR